MNTLSDWELIRIFADQQSDAAFAELVHRHLGLVYASAMRQVRSPDLAQDVAQAVFLLLARKAPTLPRQVVLSGWLFRSTRFIAARVTREEDRRHRREKEAVEMNLLNPKPENELWSAVEPHLDAAVAALGETDRQAVLLRFFEGKRLREVGERLGMGEDAAKKRVNRAIEKLRGALGRRGVVVPAVTLVGVMAGAQAQAAPAGMAQTLITATAGTAVKTSVAALVTGAARDWLWLKVRAGLAAAGSAAAVVILGSSLWMASQGRSTALVSTPIPADSPAISNIQRPTSNAQVSLLPTRPTPTSTTEGGRKILLTVIDKESGQPIAGAQAFETTSGRDRLSFTNLTGPDGTCELKVPDTTFQGLYVWLTASNHVPVTIAWQPHELTENTTLYTTYLTRGLTMKGKVVDEEGQPVSGAMIAFGGSALGGIQRENQGSPRPVIADDEGRFQTDQMPSNFPYWGMEISVYSTNFAPTGFTIMNAAELATNRIVVLPRGVSVYGHVYNAQGAPIGNAKLEDNDFHVGKQVRTSPDGSFEIPHVGPGRHEWAVGAKGFAGQQLNFRATTNDPEIIVTLQEKKPRTTFPDPTPTRLIGTVVDAKTGEPIPSFKVLEGQSINNQQLLGEGTSGRFDWTARIYTDSRYTLQVEAEGYLPAISDVRSNTVDQQRFEFRLQRSTDLTGVILQPDGQLAKGAVVGLLKHEDYAYPIIRDTGEIGRFWRPDAQTVADKTGRFSLHPQLDASRIVVSHQSGFIIVPAASATNAYISLKPWGKIDGTLQIAGQPAHNQIIELDVPATEAKDGDYELIFHAVTDLQGHFTFTNVPPGIFELRRLVNPNGVHHVRYGSDHKKRLTMHPGETVQISLSGSGRAVTGKLILSPTLGNFDWSIDLPALVARPPGLKEPQPQESKNDSDYEMARNLYTDQTTRYYLALQSDGTFRADDVPPGSYELELRVTKARVSADPTQPGWNDRIEIGAVRSTVVIPPSDGDAPVDLGTITIPVTPEERQ